MLEQRSDDGVAYYATFMARQPGYQLGRINGPYCRLIQPMLCLACCQNAGRIHVSHPAALYSIPLMLLILLMAY